jgi:hypothetical protein
MPSAAKLARELRRIGHRAADGLRALAEPARLRRHDRHFGERVRLHPGALPDRGKVALCLIFRPGGIPASTLATCRFLDTHGYAPFVVSNARLSGADLEALQATAWQVATRPNYGYDFGGYRDGIKMLAMLGVAPRRLLILNDSIWFPLSASSGLLERMEAAGPLTGPMFERKEGRRHEGHFESYMLSLAGEVVASPAFRGFWQGFVPSDQRRIVLRRGEKALTRALAAGGFEPAVLASRSLFVDRVRGLPDEALRKVLAYAAYDDPADAAEAAGLASAGDFRAAALSHIARVAAKRNVQEAFVWGAMTLFDLPFLKRRMQPLTVTMRRQYLRAVEAGHLPAPDEPMWSEIRASVPPAP